MISRRNKILRTPVSPNTHPEKRLPARPLHVSLLKTYFIPNGVLRENHPDASQNENYNM